MSSWFERTGTLGRIRRFLRDRAPGAFMVGGFLRDRTLGRETRDLDLVVPEDGLSLARELAGHLGGRFVLLDEEREVARIVLRDEGATYRVDISRRQGESLEADLALRDFTINAIAADLDLNIIDPLGGRKDLAERRLRAISEAAFRQDPLRLLRGIRLAGELRVEVEAQTERWMRRDAGLIISSAPERVQDEWSKIMALKDSAPSLHYLHRLGLLVALVPELKEGVEHPLATVAALERILSTLEEGPLIGYLSQHTAGERDRLVLLKYVALFHHIGQGEGYPPSEGVDRSPLGALMRRLRFSSLEVRLAGEVAAALPQAWSLSDGEPSLLALHRFFRQAKGGGIEALLLSLADHLATLSGDESLEAWQERLRNVRSIWSCFFEERERIFPPPLIKGDDLLREFGLEPGPLIGNLLEVIGEAQVAGEVRTREEALQLAGKLVAKGHD